MDEKEIQSLPLKLAYGFLQANGLATEAANIRASKAKLGSYDTTLKRAMVLSELTRNGLLDRFIAEKWTYGASPAGLAVRKIDSCAGPFLRRTTASCASLSCLCQQRESVRVTAFKDFNVRVGRVLSGFPNRRLTERYYP